jgi:uncharacterized membrane protein YhiD involved in acid resistance
MAVLEPFVSLPCDDLAGSDAFENTAYDSSPCRHRRFARLLWLTRAECSYSRRLVSAVLLGATIGWERRHADRPAGIRTMGLVSLGASLFTICSTFAFVSGPENWDASRISAAIPSGVGFLGAGLIFKDQQSAMAMPIVHGLTTAASLWLSAAVGIACGGELFFPATLGVAIMLLLLRFGPRNADAAEEDFDDDSFTPDFVPISRETQMKEVVVAAARETDGLLRDSRGAVGTGRGRESISRQTLRQTVRSRRPSIATSM